MRKRILILLVVLCFFGTPLPNAKTYASITMFQSYPFHRTIQTGRASWYSEQDPGINVRTANNEVFDDSGLTAAMWEVPFHQLVRVTNMDNGKSVVVRVNDRGPNKKLVRGGRIIDLSKKAFSEIAPLGRGLIPIQLELL